MKKFLRIFYSQIFNAFFPIIIVFLLLKMPKQDYTTSIFLIISFANIYLLFSDYSANISFIKNASQQGGIQLNKTAYTIVKNIHDYIGIKAIILGFGFIVWIVLCCIVPLLHDHIFSNILAYTFIIGYNINFYWVYISSHKEYFFVLSNFVSRLWLLITLLWFYFFNLNSFYLMPVAGLGSIAIAVLFFIRFAKLYNLHICFYKKELQDAWLVIKEDWWLVANSFLLMTPTTCLSLFVGFVQNPAFVIVYGITEKIFFGIRALLSVFLNSMYPVICNANDTLSKRKINILFGCFYVLLITGCVTLYLLSPLFTTYLKLMPEQATVFIKCLLYFLCTLIAISINIPFFLWLLIHNVMNKSKALIVFTASSFAVVLVYIINTFLNNDIVTISQSVFIAESIISIAFIILYKISTPSFINKSVSPTS